MRWTLATLAALAVLVAACGGEDPTTTLDDGADTVEVGDDDAGSGSDDGEPSDSGDAEDTQDDGARDAETQGGEERPAGDDDETIDVRDDHPVEARPGRWAVGEAGFVEWDLSSGWLELIEVTEADGWTARIDEDSNDEIEVDFARGNTELEFEVELDDGRIEVELKADIDPADPGVYEIGQAGSVEFGVEDGRLVLADVVVADGWDLVMDDESDEEIEFTLQSGQERWEVEIERDDGRTEMEIDYEVRSGGSSD